MSEEADKTDLPARNVSVLSRETEDGMFLFNTSTNELFRVNDTGGRIWALLGEKHSMEEITETILSEFEDADNERVRNSVREFLNKLSEKELVER